MSLTGTCYTFLILITLISLGVNLGVANTADMTLTNKMILLVVAQMSYLIVLLIWFSKKLFNPIKSIGNAISLEPTIEIQPIKYHNKTNEVGRIVQALDKINGLIHDLDENKIKNKKLVGNLLHLPTPILELDKHTNVTFNNFNAAKCFGENIHGKSLRDISKSEDLEKAIRSIQTNKKSETGEGLVNFISKQNVPVRYTIVPIKNKQNEIQGYLVFLYDNTDLYDIAIRVAKSQKELESISGVLASSSKVMHERTEELSASLSEVTGVLDQAKERSDELVNKSNNAVSNTDTASKGVKEITDNIQTVAAAIEQINISFSEITKNTSETAQKTGQTMQGADGVSKAIQNLHTVSTDIDKVVNSIHEIADQTNMLALNAAIEAASAGDAGKGFAVVASEVKELAKQTTDLTESISKEIQSVQESSKEANDLITEMHKDMTDINERNQSISASLTQQLAASSEISRTISMSSQTSKKVSTNTDEASNDVQVMAENSKQTADHIAHTNQTLQLIIEEEHKVKEITIELEGQIDKINSEMKHLHGMISEFKLIDRLM